MEKMSRQQKIWIYTRTFLKAASTLLLYIFIPAACLSLGYVLWHRDMSAREFFTYGGSFYSALGVILTIFVLYRRSKAGGRSLFEDATLFLHHVKPKKTAAFAVFGLMAALAVSAVLTLLPKWGITNSYTEDSQVMFKGRDVLFTVATMVVTAPLAEEIVFRGYMLNTFLETFSEKKSAWIVSLIFAICHGSVLWIIYALAMGLVLSYVAIREDNIFYGIMMHMGFNLFSAIIWLINSFSEAEKLLFFSKWTVAAYGMIGLLSSLLMIRWYLGTEADGYLGREESRI